MADMDNVASIARLIGATGTTRIYGLSDGSYQERAGGSAAWRHNNPGNLKLEYAGSADTVHSSRSRDQAVHDARVRYPGAIDLDQHGNVIFDTVSNGRAAQIKLIKQHGNQTVAELLGDYSKADYSGPTHHSRQLTAIYAVGDKEGVDLRTKTIGEMDDKEIAALADGISKFEGWSRGRIRALTAQQAAELAAHPQRDRVGVPAHMASHQIPAAGHNQAVLRHGGHGDAVGEVQQQLRDLGYTDVQGIPLAVDGKYGAQTEAAVRAFQTGHGLVADGRVGAATHSALGTQAQSHQQGATGDLLPVASVFRTNPFENPHHPQHALYSELKGYLPRASDERLAQFTAACHGHGISAGGLQSIVMPNDATVAFRGRGVLAALVAVDIGPAAPTLQQSAQQVQVHAQQLAPHVNVQVQHGSPVGATTY